MDWHRIIAAMDHSLHERLADALRGVSSPKRHVESAGVAVKICKAPGHASEDMEIFGIEKAAFRRAVGSDNLDAALGREHAGSAGKMRH